MERRGFNRIEFYSSSKGEEIRYIHVPECHLCVKNDIVNFLCSILNNDCSQYLRKKEKINIANDFFFSNIDVKHVKEYIDSIVLCGVFDSVNELTQNQRFYNQPFLSEFGELDKNSIKANINMFYDSNNEFITVYTFQSLNDLVTFVLYKVFEKNVLIKQCPNCMRYFSPKRKNATYCDNASPQRPSSTCQQYSAWEKDKIKIKENEALTLKKKIYSQKQMKAKRYPDIKLYTENFEKFKKDLNVWKQKLKTCEKTYEEYLLWLKSVKGDK